MYTFGQLKNEVRAITFPAGEPDNLVVAHDKLFVDAVVDLQTIVPCLQRDNTDLFPQCATLYNCGATVFDAPRGIIRSLSIIDKINADTGLEDAEADDDWCSEIEYTQIDPCHIRAYLGLGAACGCCYPSGYFFDLPLCTKSYFPIPTDEGVPAGLPLLPLGYHYPQTSTDRTWGRAAGGVWAIERGKITIVPWIQSTETVVIRWDGIKRTWTDADAIEQDPLFLEAVEEYVRWKNAGKFEKDPEEAQRAAIAYAAARQMLWRNCREETRVRSRGDSSSGGTGSQARASSIALSTLFFNEEQSFTATCDASLEGDPLTVTIPAGTIGSSISVADANQKAMAQAQEQAEAQIVCEEPAVTYWNAEVTRTAECEHEEGAPVPDGSPVTITIPANTVSSIISQADADQQAAILAMNQARAGLSCTYKNRAQTAYCPADEDVSATVPAGTHSSTVSQAMADKLALDDAQNQVNADPACPGNGVLCWNTLINRTARYVCRPARRIPGSPIIPASYGQVIVIVPANTFSAATVADANTLASNAADQLAAQLAAGRVNSGKCDDYTVTYPGI